MCANHVEVEGLDGRGGALSWDIRGARNACIDGGVVYGEGNDAGQLFALGPAVEGFVLFRKFLAQAVWAHVLT